MIDRLTVQGTLKTFELGDLSRGAQVVFAQTSTTKLKPSVEYVPSPLTEAQIEMTIAPEFQRDRELLGALFKLPLASAAIGQNYMHGWAECLRDELKVASLLLRVVLEQYLFRPEEVDRFIETAEVLSTEWTWHVASTSYRGAKNLLMRVYRQIKVLHAHNSRHDIGIEGYTFYDENQRESLKVYLKNGSAMKFYVKVDEMSDTKGRKPRGKALHAEHRADPTAIRAEIGTHLRVEAIPGRAHLREHGLLNPGTWTPEKLEAVVEEVLTLAGFAVPYANNPRNVNVSTSSKAVRRTFDLYCRGEGFGKLSDATITRHRKALIPLGVDIAIDPADHQHLSGSIGRQLHYSNRWKAPEPLRKFMMSEITLPILCKTLSEMLDAVRNDNTPEKLARVEHQRFRDAIPGKTRSPV
jgi:hypothetical protein